MQIHQVKGRHVNSYVVEDSNGLLVVDVAWRGEKYVLGYIREVLKRDPGDVKLVICTHGDPDHSGGIVNMARVCHAQLGIPYATQSPLLKMINDPVGILFRLSGRACGPVPGQCTPTPNGTPGRANCRPIRLATLMFTKVSTVNPTSA